jgi:hypothetical protein
VRLGFSWDERFLAVMGEPWPGAAAAARRVSQEAEAKGHSAEEERRERARIYDQWLAELTRDADTAEREASRAKLPQTGS